MRSFKKQKKKGLYLFFFLKLLTGTGVIKEYGENRKIEEQQIPKKIPIIQGEKIHIYLSYEHYPHPREALCPRRCILKVAYPTVEA